MGGFFPALKTFICVMLQGLFYLLFHLTQNFMRSLETADFFSGNRSYQITYFISFLQTHRDLRKIKGMHLKIKKTPAPAWNEWKKGEVWCGKDKRRWGPKTAVRFDEVLVCLSWGCATEEHFTRKVGTVSMQDWEVAKTKSLRPSCFFREHHCTNSTISHPYTCTATIFVFCFPVVHWCYYPHVHFPSVMQTTAANIDRLKKFLLKIFYIIPQKFGV